MAQNATRSSFLTWLVDPLTPSREGVERTYRLDGVRRGWLVPTALGAALLVLSLVGWVVEPAQFYFSYLVGWVFCLSLSVGALFFIIIQHLTKAWWGVVVRRLGESLMWGFPLLLVLGLPLVFGMHDLYHWTHAELYVEGGPEYDAIIAGKRPYLNQPFFFARILLYFAVWTYLAWRLYTGSVRHDVRPSRDTPRDLRYTSAWGLPVMAVTTAFASYDLLMSLDPHWFSTIFGVYFFAGAILSAFAVITLGAALLQRLGGTMRRAVTKEHYQDLGKYLFGFTVFWAYIGFCQYMLIWYAGLPEETLWYRHRLEHGWGWHAGMLVALHFIVPFVVLLPRFTKRLVPVMSVVSVWFLVMQWFDLYWVVMPVLREDAAFHWLDFTCWLGLAGVFFGLMVYRLSRHALVPVRDPHLAESLHFQNA